MDINISKQSMKVFVLYCKFYKRKTIATTTIYICISIVHIYICMYIFVIYILCSMTTPFELNKKKKSVCLGGYGNSKE